MTTPTRRRTTPALRAGLLALATTAALAVGVVAPGAATARVSEPTTTKLGFSNDDFSVDVRDADGDPVVGVVELLLDGEVVAESTLSRIGYKEAVWNEARLPDLTRRQASSIQVRYLGSTTHQASSSEVYERTPPVLTARMRSKNPMTSHGWFRSPVTVHWSCAEGSAFVGSCPTAERVTSTAMGMTREAHGFDGGIGSAVVDVRIDRVAPVLTVVRAPGRIPTCLAVDALSGLDTCRRTLGKARMGDDGISRRAFTMTATDLAGNTTVRRSSYRIG